MTPGLCIKSLKGKPGIFSARWAKNMEVFKINESYLKKMENKKDRAAKFVCSLTFVSKKKLLPSLEILMDQYLTRLKEKRDLVMIQYLFRIQKKITFGQMTKLKKIKMDHRFIAFKKLKRKIKIL